MQAFFNMMEHEQTLKSAICEVMLQENFQTQKL